MSNRPPPLPDWARKFRPPVDRAALGLGASNANRQSVTFGLVATLIVNVLLFLAPRQFLGANLSILPDSEDVVELDLTDPPEEALPELTFVEEPEPEPEPDPEQLPPKVVQTNPDAPEVPPPETRNESDRDGRAANEITPSELSPDHTPAREGDDLPTERIVAGEPIEELPAELPQPEGDPVPLVIPSLPTEQNPLAGQTDDRGESPDGVGSSRAPEVAETSPVDERVEGERDESVDTLPFVPPVPPPGSRTAAPAPRPRIERTTVGSAQRQFVGVAETGTIQVDARFSEYGEYINRLVDAVGQHWASLCSKRAYSERGTQVTIRFILTADGNVYHLTTLDRTTQTVGEYLCRTAIEQGQPFGVWTPDMVASLRDEEPVALTFYYR